MRTNLAIERHAGKIYTRAMFEQFGHILHECDAYEVEEIKKGKLYATMHTEAERREKWCGVSYKVCSVEERSVSVVNSLTWEYSTVMC